VSWRRDVSHYSGTSYDSLITALSYVCATPAATVTDPSILACLQLTRLSMACYPVTE